jgi:hypothetical protein
MTPPQESRGPHADPLPGQEAPADGSAVEPDQESAGAADEELVWAFDDLEATWWDDVWPFRDDHAAEEPAVVRPLTVGPTLAEAPPATTNAADPAPLPAPGSATLPAREDPWWMRQFVWVSALVAAAFVVAGLDVLGMGHATDDPARLLTSRVYASPVTLQPGTSYVRSRVLPSGDLVVTHWIRTRGPVDSLQVETPATRGLTPGSVTVSHLVLAADGRADPAASSGSRSGTQTLRFPFAHTIYLQYRLSGVVQATGPGRRALARLTALDVVAGGNAVRTTQIVLGAKVLALACTSGPSDALPVPCGAQDAKSWSVRLAPGRQPTRVMAQVELS